MTTNTNTSPTANTTTGSNDKTHRPVVWQPATDSSPQHRALAAKDGRVHIDITDGACLCGCNQKADARFRPGHDAKLKGQLTRAELHNAGFTLHAGDATVEVTPLQLAAKLSGAKHDWSAALKLAVDRAKKAQAEAKARQAAAAAKKAEAAKAAGASTKLTLADFAA